VLRDPGQATTAVQVYANFVVFGDTLAAGGLAFVAPDKHSIAALNTRMTSLRRVPEAGAGMADEVTAPLLERDLQSAETIANGLGVQTVAFVLLSPNGHHEGAEPSARIHLHARLLLNEAIEVLLFDRVLPWLKEVRQVRLDIGTTVRPFAAAEAA